MNDQQPVRKAGYGPTLREHLIRSIEESEPHFPEVEAELRRVRAEQKLAKGVRPLRHATKKPASRPTSAPQPAPTQKS